MCNHRFPAARRCKLWSCRLRYYLVFVLSEHLRQMHWIAGGAQYQALAAGPNPEIYAAQLVGRSPLPPPALAPATVRRREQGYQERVAEADRAARRALADWRAQKVRRHRRNQHGRHNFCMRAHTCSWPPINWVRGHLSFP